MSSEHKRPLYAFAMVAMICAFFVGSGLRSDAVDGLLRVADIPASLNLVERTERAPEPEADADPSPEVGSPLLSVRAPRPALAPQQPAERPSSRVPSSNDTTSATPVVHTEKPSASPKPERAHPKRPDDKQKARHTPGGKAKGHHGQHPWAKRHGLAPGHAKAPAGRAHRGMHGLAKGHTKAKAQGHANGRRLQSRPKAGVQRSADSRWTQPRTQKSTARGRGAGKGLSKGAQSQRAKGRSAVASTVTSRKPAASARKASQGKKSAAAAVGSRASR